MTRRLFLVIVIAFSAVALGRTALAAAPLPPQDLRVTAPANLRRVELAWDGSVTAGVSYRVYRSTASESRGEIIADKVVLLSYIDTAVNYGTTYYYRVAAIAETLESSLVGPASATPNLSAPRNVLATNTEQGGEIKLTWERPDAGLVLTYNIYRSTNDQNLGDLIAREVVGVEYLDTRVENGTRYYYRVKSVDRDGREGAASTTVIGVASDKKPPAAVTVYASFESPDRAYVSWSVPSGERSLSYVLYRSQSPNATGDEVARLAETSFRQYSLPPGATYYYSVVAIDGAGNKSEASKQAKVVISPSGSVVNTPKVSDFTAEGTVNAGEILLRWRLPNDDRVSYSRIYRSLTVNGEPGQIADKVTGSSYLDKTVPAGWRYYYTIRLVGKDGTEYQPSAQASAVAFDPADPANKSRSTLTPSNDGAAPAKASAVKPASKTYAYGKPRMTNLRLEAVLASNLRKFLLQKLGAQKVPRVLHPSLIKAYLYGGYTVDEIADTIVNGPGKVHPAIHAVLWRRSQEYKRH